MARVLRLLPYLILPGVGVAFLIGAATNWGTAKTTGDGYALDSFFLIMGLSFLLLPFVLLLIIGLVSVRQNVREARIRQQGTPATARLAGMRRTGLAINDVPQHALTLDVTTQTGARYQVVKKMLLEEGQLILMRPGVSIPIWIDPGDPQEVLLDFEPLWEQEARRGA